VSCYAHSLGKNVTVQQSVAYGSRSV
jgi:hypothetical protein